MPEDKALSFMHPSQISRSRMELGPSMVAGMFVCTEFVQGFPCFPVCSGLILVQ